MWLVGQASPPVRPPSLSPRGRARGRLIAHGPWSRESARADRRARRRGPSRRVRDGRGHDHLRLCARIHVHVKYDDTLTNVSGLMFLTASTFCSSPCTPKSQSCRHAARRSAIRISLLFDSETPMPSRIHDTWKLRSHWRQARSVDFSRYSLPQHEKSVKAGRRKRARKLKGETQ